MRPQRPKEWQRPSETNKKLVSKFFDKNMGDYRSEIIIEQN